MDKPVVTDEDKIEELLSRGVENLFPTRAELKKELLSGRRLCLYSGIDPTAPTLHVGHGASLLKLREFQDLGHEVIVLLGSFTAMIGDPSDKPATRKKLTKEEVQNNLQKYQEQIGKILNIERTKFVFNGDWLAPLSFAEVIELASEFTVQQMLERDMFQERLKVGAPIYLHEFLYPLMQGYDSVALAVDAEVGGNDQTFNMLAGRTMLKRRGKEKFVIAMKLLTDPTGRKMGKSEGNMVTLADNPADMYGKVMSWPDSLIESGFEICTRVSLAGLTNLVASDPLGMKKSLAREIVKIYHGEDSARRAEESFLATFRDGGVPTDIVAVDSLPGESLAEILIRTAMVSSRAEFRRLLLAGAITTEKGETVTDLLAPPLPTVYRIGKKRFLRVN